MDDFTVRKDRKNTGFTSFNQKGKKTYAKFFFT